MDDLIDHYAVLDVPEDASEKDIRDAYRVLIRANHPDRIGPEGTEKSKTINHAYDILSDPVSRREFDRERPPAPGSGPSSSSGHSQPQQSQPPRPEAQRPPPRKKPVLAFDWDIEAPDKPKIGGRLLVMALFAVAAGVVIHLLDRNEVWAPVFGYQFALAVAVLFGNSKFLYGVGIIFFSISLFPNMFTPDSVGRTTLDMIGLFFIWPLFIFAGAARTSIMKDRRRYRGQKALNVLLTASNEHQSPIVKVLLIEGDQLFVEDYGTGLQSIIPKVGTAYLNHVIVVDNLHKIVANYHFGTIDAAL